MKIVGLSVIALGVGGLVCVAALAGQPSHRGGTLRIASGGVDSLDSAISWTSESWMIQYATCAKLFNYADASGAAGARLVPEVVDHYAVSPDGTTYTFDLKRTYRFQTGARVTARSFADAFDRDANPAIKSPAITYMHEIVGADAAIHGKARSISGIRVLGAFRLQMRLRKRVGDLTARLTDPAFCPVPPGTPAVPVEGEAGSGPYYVASQIANRQIVLKRNRFYGGGRPANPDQIVWTLGETRDQCLDDVEQDRIDYCAPPGFPANAARAIAASYGVNKPNGQFHVSPGISTSFFVFNHDRPAFHGRGQIPLEKAINFAIDRPALTRPYGYEAGMRTDQMLPGAVGEDASIYPIQGADPATARKWLARAKYKPSRLVLYASSSPAGVAVAQVFAFDLKQIGIDVAVSYFDVGTLTDKAGTRGQPFDVAMESWSVDYADPAAFFEPLLDGRHIGSKGNADEAYLDDPVINARIDAANSLTGEARRRAWVSLDADLMRNEPPWAPYLNFNNRDLVSTSLGCYVANPLYGVDLAAACKK